MDNKNKIIPYIYNNISSISINTTTTKKYISNSNYSSIIYLLIKKEFTYFGEIRRMFGITTNFHLPNLEREGLIIRRDPTKQELDYLTKLNKSVDKYHFKDSIYSLTKEGYEYFTNPKTYDIIKVFSMPTIDDYIILQQAKYEKLSREIIKNDQQEELNHQAELRRLGIVLE